MTYLESIVLFEQSLGFVSSQTPGDLVDLVRLGIVRCQHDLNDAHRKRSELGRCATCPTSSLVASSWARLKLRNSRQSVLVVRDSLVSVLDKLCENILESIEDRRLVQNLVR